jgi:hypothetical protein
MNHPSRAVSKEEEKKVKNRRKIRKIENSKVLKLRIRRLTPRRRAKIAIHKVLERSLSMKGAQSGFKLQDNPANEISPIVDSSTP